MAGTDLSFKDRSSPVVIVGSDSTGGESTPVKSSLNGELTTSDGLNSGGAQGSLTLVTQNVAYEAKVGVSPVSGRKILIITAENDMFWGFTNTVTTSSGTPLKKNQTVVFSINPNDSSFKVWLVSATNASIARIAESP